MATLHISHGTPYDLPRRTMLDRLAQGGIKDACVMAAMTVVPRELFVEPGDIDEAYADRPLAISGGQSISQPYLVALMIEALRLSPDARVLEIGTGSGYSAAVLSQLASHVYSIERIPALAQAARDRLAALGYDGIDIRCSDGSLGWPERAPFDAIAVMAGAPDVPPALVDQLAIGGRMVLPIGRRDRQSLALLEKRSKSYWTVSDLGPVHFVPLIGKQGWPDSA